MVDFVVGSDDDDTLSNQYSVWGANQPVYSRN